VGRRRWKRGPCAALREMSRQSNFPPSAAARHLIVILFSSSSRISLLSCDFPTFLHRLTRSSLLYSCHRPLHKWF
jgi:hypothetical protein